VNAEYRGVITPLHETARSGRKEVVELLIANGADVNAKNRNGDTPLDYAITFKRTELADLFRKYGAKTAEELKTAGN
jgi:ankyrin repeat protein